MLQAASQGPVRILTIDRPDVRNAFNDELIAALTDAFVNLPSGTRAVVLRAEGPAFCGGGDLNWMRKAANYTEEQNTADALKLAQLFQAVVNCPAVVIARVHGAAFGGGCGLVAACDVAIAAPEAKFSFSEVKLGLIPATISPFVVEKIGRGHARSLFSTGEIFGAEKALRIGLVHDIVDAAGLDALIDERLNSILMSGPLAVAASKQLANESPLPIEETARRLAQARAGEEGKAGVAAFLEKRKAEFVVEWPQS
jgi:enoyl-CoA hydratase/carnithine racemase